MSKTAILAEKPSQAKAYADGFSVKRHEGYLEILPSPIFPEGTFLHNKHECLNKHNCF